MITRKESLPSRRSAVAGSGDPHASGETMNNGMRWTLAVLGAAVGGGAVATAISTTAWARQSERMVERLYGLSTAGAPRVYSPDELQGLPAPVAKYFQFALTPGQPLIRSARIEHEGEFRGSLDAAWSPFHSVQHLTVDRPGFVWDATVRMAPLVSVRVRDSYVDGHGGMLARVAGLVTVVDQKDTPHLNAGSLHRWFLEGTWYPTSLLPSNGVRWEALDERSARATFTDAGITLSMDVHFGEGGEIVRLEADRMRDVDGTGVPTRFVAHVGEYRRIDGMMIPVAGEVEWLLPEGRLAFWRGRLASATYQFSR